MGGLVETPAQTVVHRFHVRRMRMLYRPIQPRARARRPDAVTSSRRRPRSVDRGVVPAISAGRRRAGARGARRALRAPGARRRRPLPGPRREPTEDLTQVAMLGSAEGDRAASIRAAGFAFSTYATPTMLGELKRYFRDAAGRCTSRAASRSARSRSRASATSCRPGSAARRRCRRLAEALGASEEQTLEAIEAYHARQVPSLEHAADDELGLSPAEHARRRGRATRAGRVPGA